MKLLGQATPVAESWREETIDAMKLQLPCPLVRFDLDLVPREKFYSDDILPDLSSGALGTRRIMIGWVAGPSLPDRTNPSWFDDFLKKMAASEKWEVIGSNPAANFNGFRGKRHDYLIQTAPRIRIRCLVLERERQNWLLETDALESDADAERIFQRMAQSARPMLISRIMRTAH
jgi:hypothetical protein